MRIPMLSMLVCLISTAALANDGDDSLRMLLAKSDVVVLGEFTSDLISASTEQGVVNYQGDFQVARWIAGATPADRRAGKTIKVNATRFENEPADRLPVLSRGGKCILFLARNDRTGMPTYVTSDIWLGIQPASSAIVHALARLADAPQRGTRAKTMYSDERRLASRKWRLEIASELLRRDHVDLDGFSLERASVLAYCPPQPTQYDWLVSIPSRQGEEALLVAVTDAGKAWRLDPKGLNRLEPDANQPARKDDDVRPPQAATAKLDGEWRLFLPAGFEYPATLTMERENHYRLTPGGLNFGAHFEVQGDCLVSARADEKDTEKEKGVFRWKIVSPYLLTLVEQPAHLSSNYLGAVFVRHSPAQQLRLQRDAPAKAGTNAATGPPRTTLAELEAMIEAGNYQRIRQQKLGHDIESVGEVRIVSEKYPDWVVVELPGKHLSATLRNVRDDHGLKKGDKLKFRGLIVAEGYGALTVWVNSSSRVE